ncbi:MAG: 4-vinyl reductase [Deltaproteobacteria bacterium]|nr:4-vinyl reductase [Candidatus Zymogenaceae bacterium]
MTTKTSLTHLAYRSCVDAIGDVLGENGKKSVLRFAGLGDMIENPIDYDPEERVPYEFVTKLFVGVRDILGDRGYEAVMYRGGAFAVKNIVKHSQPLQGLIAMDFDPVEKLKLGYQAYVRNAGYDPEKTLEYLPENKQIINHRPDCTECDEILRIHGGTKVFTKPSCAFIRGLLKGIGDCFEKEISVSVVEEKCRLLGDPQCQYRITYTLK